MPLRFLRGSYARLTLTVIALACGVALVCAIDLVNRAVLRAFVEVVDTMAGRASLQITGGEGGFIPEEITATVARVPGVELAVPVVTATAFTADGSGELLTVQGIEVTNEDAVRVYEARAEGGLELSDPLEFLNQPDSILLTRTFAERRGLSVGDQVRMETPTGRRTFMVRGLLEPQGVARAYGGNLVVMDLYAAEAAFTRPEYVNRVDVVVGRSASVTAVADAIRTVLPAGLHVEAPAQRKADLHKAMQSLQVLLQGVGLVALVAAFLIAFNRLSTVFDGRAWQLGVLRAGGLRMRVVWWELVKESLLLGCAGVALGIPLGISLARVLLPVIAMTTALNYKLVAPETSLTISATSFVMAGILGVGAALLAALLPALRAARVSLAATILGRGVEQTEAHPWFFWVLRITIAAALLTALVLQAATRMPVWGLLATGLIAVATALAARPLLQLLSATVMVRMESLVGRTERFASTFVTQNPRRSALTVAMLGVGLGSVLWLEMIAYSFEKSTLDTLSQAMRADLVVSSAHIASGYLEVPVDDSIVADINGIPGAQEAIGVRVRDWEHQGGPIALDAFDPAYFRDPRFGQWPLVGPRLPDAWESVARGAAVIVSNNFVLNLHVKAGDQIDLETPTGRLPVRIAGVTVDFASPRGTIEMSRDLYKRFWNDPQVTRVFVRSNPETSPESLREAITQVLGKRYGLRILSSGELMEYFRTQVRRAFAPLDALAGMALFVVLVGMSDTLAAGIVERTREMGVMRALGLRRVQLSRMVIVEAVMMGILGLVLALLSGLSLGTIWVQTTFPYLLGWVLELEIPYAQLALVAAITIAVCIIGAALPAARAARLEPATALRYE